MSRESKLAKNTAILAIGTFLPKLASFITLPILTGYLTTAEYGTYDLITVLASLVLPAATLQIQAAAFRFLIDEKENINRRKSIITNIFGFIGISSLIALIILYFCLFSITSYLRLFVCLYFLIDIYVNACLMIVRGLSKNLDYSISAIISALGKMIFAVICVWQMRLGLFGACMALCASELISIIFLFIRGEIYKYIDFSTISIAETKRLLKYSWPMVPNSMSMWVMRVSDRFVVTLFMGVSANAVYSVANKIPQLLTMAQSTFTMAWQENASIVSKDKDVEAYYTSMFRTMYDLMAGFLGLLIAATPILFALVIRGDYAAAYYQIPVLFLGMFFYSMSSFLGGIYVAYKATKSVGITTTLAAVCNLVVDLATIHFIGLYAASGSTLVSYLFLFVYRLIDVRHLVKMKYDYRHMVIVMGIMVIECVLCFQQKLVLNCINIIFGTVVFFVLNQSFVKAVLKKGQGIMNKVLKKA